MSIFRNFLELLVGVIDIVKNRYIDNTLHNNELNEDNQFTKPQQFQDDMKERFCAKCGSIMKMFPGDVLVCPKCGYEIEAEYWFEDLENKEDYEEYYPTREEVLGIASDEDENSDGETYDEVYGEFDDYLPPNLNK